MNKPPDDNDRKQAGAFDPLDTVPYVPEGAKRTAPAGPKKTRKRASGRPDPLAKRIIALADRHGIELFHSERVPYAVAAIGARRETLPIRSQDFAALLVRWLWESEQATAPQQSLTEAQQTLAARALYGGDERHTFFRVGRSGRALYLDLGDASGRAVETTADGWRIIERPPVHFVRSSALLALPTPERGGSLAELFHLIALPEEQRPLLIGWLLAALRPVGPFPVLAVHGEQGSGKTTACRMIRRLADPHEAELRGPPDDDRTLFVSARHSWVLGYDNISTIPRWLSDALCCIVSGGSYTTRKLYTDDGEALFKAQRPILLNGIEEVATRPDLLERCLVLSLPVIPEEQRRPEDELWREYDAMHPRLLGALLDALACALRELSSVPPQRWPRMADFAKWATAAECAMGLPRGGFLTAYTANIRAASDLPLEASPIVAPLRAMLAKLPPRLDGPGATWTGTATALLGELRQSAQNEETKQPDWPRNGQALSGQLKRLMPNLRRVGIHVSAGRASDRNRTRNIEIQTGASAP